MKTVTISLPEQLRAEIDKYVRDGWFLDEGDVLRTALHEFVQSQRLRLSEEFMLEDIQWAVSQKPEPKECL